MTKQAFGILGERGIIRSAEGHECSECVHDYKETSDQMGFYGEDATVGLDEYGGPILPRIQVQGQAEGPAVQDDEVMEISEGTVNAGAKVRMVVLDGIVMGPNVSFSYIFY